MRIQIFYQGQMLDSREVAVLGNPPDFRKAKKHALKLGIDGGQVRISEALGASFRVFDDSGQPVDA